MVAAEKNEIFHIRMNLTDLFNQKNINPEKVIRREGTWKDRLHTRAPYGLNDN